MAAASEAQRLIGISLTKIAQSRTHRGGVSLHKNLLVATVLQKARYIFMEEAYNMVHYQQQQCPMSSCPQPKDDVIHDEDEDNEDTTTDLVGLTAEEGVLDYYNHHHHHHLQSTNNNNNKENHPPELTYLDLDTSLTTTTTTTATTTRCCTKRRRSIADTETEEAVNSILPTNKRSRPSSESTMEIDRITSLVSIFSFTPTPSSTTEKTTTNTLCSTQAQKDTNPSDQRPFIAMTV